MADTKADVSTPASVAEKIVDAIMAQLSLELDTLDPDEWDERRLELIQCVTQVLAEERVARSPLLDVP